jgi:hypothetical protein
MGKILGTWKSTVFIGEGDEGFGARKKNTVHVQLFSRV